VLLEDADALADFGKNWSRVRFAISSGMPTNSA